MKKGKLKLIKNQRSILDFFTSFKNPSIVNVPLKTEIKQECPLENESNNNEHLLKNSSIEIPTVTKDGDSTNKYVNVDKLIYQLLNGKVVLKRLSPRFITKLTNSSIPKHITKHKIKIKSKPEERFYRNIPNDKKIPNKLIKRCNNCNTTLENPWGHGTSCPVCTTSVVYKCMKCSQEFKTLCLIKHHWKNKCNPTRYMQCLKCNYKTCTKQVIINHIRRVHMTFAKNIHCKFCRYATSFNDYLEKHVRRTHGIVKVKVETKTEGLCDMKH